MECALLMHSYTKDEMRIPGQSAWIHGYLDHVEIALPD